MQLMGPRRVWRALSTIARLCAFAAQLGVGWRTKWRLASSLVGWRYEEQIPMLRSRMPNESTLTLQDCGQRFQLVLSTAPGESNMLVLYEIFGRRVYDLKLPQPPRVIVDLGSYIGISPVYFRLRYPEARIYCVEPDPKHYARLRRNIAPLPNMEGFNYAVASRSGRQTLYRSAVMDCGQSLYPAGNGQQAVDVEGITLEELIRRLGVQEIDLLKFDVEGAEWETFRTFRPPVPIRTVIGELHPVGPSDEPGLCARFRREGYEVSLSQEPFFGVTIFLAIKR